MKVLWEEGARIFMVTMQKLEFKGFNKNDSCAVGQYWGWFLTVLLSNDLHQYGKPASSGLQLYLIIQGM